MKPRVSPQAKSKSPEVEQVLKPKVSPEVKSKSCGQEQIFKVKIPEVNRRSPAGKHRKRSCFRINYYVMVLCMLPIKTFIVTSSIDAYFLFVVKSML